MGAPFQLPLDGTASPPPMPVAAVEGETSFIPGEQYRRLFGLTRPDQAIVPVDPTSLRDNAALGSLPALCDPTQAASHSLYQFLAALGHPSARSLADLAALRLRHIAKGHTPEADAAHGWVHFKRQCDDAFRDAIAARSRETRRKRMIIAVAILVALIDAEDFLSRRQEQHDAPDQ